MDFDDKFQDMFKRLDRNIDFDGYEIHNFTYLDNLVHGGDKEISLNCDITLSNSEKRLFSEGICLDVDELVIEGNGHTIDAAGMARIFNVTADDVSISNVTFKNGYAESGSAASISSQSSVRFEGCIFTENSSICEGADFDDDSRSRGGAIHNDGRLIMCECLFDSNSAQSCGAILNNGEMELHKVIFINNASKRLAGVIGNYGKLLVDDAKFIDNKSSFGGMILNRGSLLLENVEFTGNRAKQSGGAIFSSNEAEVIDCEMRLNSRDDYNRN